MISRREEIDIDARTTGWGWIMYYQPGEPAVIIQPDSSIPQWHTLIRANVIIRWSWSDEMVVIKNRWGEVNCSPEETRINP